MFKDSARGDLNGFLDAGSLINGELHFEDTFRVDGKLVGKVVSDGDLVIGEQGEVDGEVVVGRVFVTGVVRGRVSATRRIELTAGGRAYADLETPCLVIEEGATFEGQCRMKVEATKVRRLPVQEQLKP
jgi:cytoskeletal protein CcmA (bactofilin family)